MTPDTERLKRAVECLSDYAVALPGDVLDICEEVLMFRRRFDACQTSDYLLVAGYSRCLDDRAPHAAALLAAVPTGRAILSGGRQIPNTGLSESLAMYHYLSASGVHADRLLVENDSRTTLENAELSVQLITARHPALDRVDVGVVTSSFHIRRLMLALHASAAKAGRQDTLKFAPAPSTCLVCAPDTWHATVLGRAMVAREIEILCRQMSDGKLPVFEL
jgi:hypothetical protein